LAVALAAVLLALPVLPAFADDAPATIAPGVVVAGIDLSGLTAAEAEATLTANVSMPAALPLAVRANNVTFSLNATSAVDLDVSGLVSDAVAATTPVDIGPRYSVDAFVVSKFVAGVASRTDCDPVSATRKMKKRKLTITASKIGLKVDKSATASAVTTALAGEFAAGGLLQPAVPATVATTQPKTTATNIGKTIVVVLGTRWLYLYSGAKVQKKFRCAVGQPRYPTPRGTWKIVRKVKNPSWYNNGSGWAANMPSYIGPGSRNPLGTRALYLNASGIRIHGIPASENSSIGHAASHGCIRLKNSNAVKLYPLVSVGTPVYIVK
jgi:lipoprotein-anchoring transpeptidase ErfK/SrfK